MASPQIEDGYTRIANEIIDKLIDPSINPLTGIRELQAVFFVIRKTYGFNKKFDIISLSQFQEQLKTSRPHVCHILQKLRSSRILLRSKDGYGFNKNWEEWIVPPMVPARVVPPKAMTSTTHGTFASTMEGNGVVPWKAHTKDILTKDKFKDTITKDIAKMKFSRNELITKMFNLFRTINPGLDFNNRTQRNACDFLIDQLGEKVIVASEIAISVQSQQYAPVITTPLQLKAKLGNLRTFYTRSNNQPNQSLVATI